MTSAAVLVTGASGFVGRAVVARLLANGVEVRAALRGTQGSVPAGVRVFAGLSLSGAVDWSGALDGVDTVIHCAARVHVMCDTSADPLTEYRRVNVEGTRQLARQAAAAAVRRFVYVSSIKVNGEFTAPGRPFRADDAPRPVDPYGISKHEAELALRELAATSGMGLVVIRSPLVYGPGVRANFRSMMGWLRRGIPLPLGAIDNRRSLVALDNLCDLIVTCVHHPAAAGQTFLAGDGEDVSTSELLQRLGRALGRPARLLPVPTGLLRAALGLVGKRDIAQRLCGSLQVDISPARDLLGWRPPVRLDEGLRRAAAAFLDERLS